MSGIWLVSYVLLWFLNALMFIVLAATIRQVGLIHHRIPPVGARTGNPGPDIGELAPTFVVADVDGVEVSIGGELLPTVVIFLSTSCSVCDDIAPSIRSFARGERGRVEVVVIVRGEEGPIRKYARTHGMIGLSVVASETISDSFGVSAFPYAVLVDSNGAVRSKGVVNHLEHLESLVDALRVGLPTVEAAYEGFHKETDRAVDPAGGG
ncbi:MAG: hypothetical protein ACRDLB_15385 [Actinomycetota bacterium]